MGEYERTASIGSAGVLMTTCMHRKAYVTREALAVILDVQDQLTTRESQVGPFRVAERSVVYRGSRVMSVEGRGCAGINR